ncbi:MAG: hypothetical protein IV100_18890 [Myxococcales bacterium]|nr:hypothetical protein [Myxococcales bacterium]
MQTPFGPHFQNTFFQLRVSPGKPAYGYARWVAGSPPKQEFQYLLPRSYTKPGDEATASWMNESIETSYDEWTRYVARMKTGAIPYDFGVGKVREFVQTEFKDSFAAHFSEYPLLDQSGEGKEKQFNDGFVQLTDPAQPDQPIGGVAIITLEAGHAELWHLTNPATFPRARFLAQYFNYTSDAFARLQALPTSNVSRRYAVLTTFTINGLPPH